VDEADHTEAIATDATTIKDETEIAASINDVSTAPQVFFGVERSTEVITLPVERISSLDVTKPADAIATDETPINDESEATSSIHGFSAASEVLMVGETSSKAYITLPVEKLSFPEVHGPVEVVATGVLGEVETTAWTDNGSVITAEKALSEDAALPVENNSLQEVHQPTEEVAREETTNFEDNKIATATYDDSPAVQEHFQDKTTPPAEKVSSVEVHEPTEAVVSEENTNFDDDKISASTCDGTPAVQGRSQDNITLPAISSLEVHEPAKAVVSEETINFDDNKIAATTCDGTPAMQGRSQDNITLPVEKVLSLEAHEPANVVASKETTTSDDSKITTFNYYIYANCKHFVIPLVQLNACMFHHNTCIVSFLFYCLYSRVLAGLLKQ